MYIDKESRNAINFILLIGVAVTLYINPRLQDPINSPKLWVLILSVPITLSYLIFNYKKLLEFKAVALMSLLFIFSLIAVFLNTDNKIVGLIGDVQRRNGIITYLALIFIWLLTVIFYNPNQLSSIKKYIYILGFCLSVYGLAQSLGFDFIKWQNPYNQVIATLGNPNFSAAMMAILITFITPILFDQKISNYERLFAFFLSGLLIYVMLQTQAKQGILATICGLMIFIYYRFVSEKKIIKNIYIIFTSLLIITSVLGMLQKGPLTHLLYKDSVSVRGYYWRAALKMFESHPLLGVGMDRYLYYFKEYREVNYPIKYGFNITSSNAHNLFLQFFGTGGALLGSAYLIIVFFTFFAGLKSIKKTSSENEKKLLVGIFSSWIAYQAQSLISIDNIGVSIWGWIFSGLLIGATWDRRKLKIYQQSKHANLVNLRQILSLFLLIPIIFLVSKLNWVESSTYLARGEIASEQMNNPIVDRVISNNLSDLNYKVLIASDLYKVGNLKKATSILERVVSQDSRNDDALNSLAFIYESQSQLNDANRIRLKLSKLDPWGASNLLQLGLNYKTLGEVNLMNQTREKILSFAANTEVGKRALAELV